MTSGVYVRLRKTGILTRFEKQINTKLTYDGSLTAGVEHQYTFKIYQNLSLKVSPIFQPSTR